ncbi:MAG: CsbD family protein [Phycisphaeraceae bacterium]|nr:CsbD family protein [Phycisphaeraceae bacterium]
MPWEVIEGNWRQLKGKLQEEWGRLTNDDLDEIRGRREQLVGRLQELYGKSRDAVEDEVERFCLACH